MNVSFTIFIVEKTGLDADHEHLVRQFHHAFMHENALNPMIFPSLRSVSRLHARKRTQSHDLPQSQVSCV